MLSVPRGMAGDSLWQGLARILAALTAANNAALHLFEPRSLAARGLGPDDLILDVMAVMQFVAAAWLVAQAFSPRARRDPLASIPWSYLGMVMLIQSGVAALTGVSYVLAWHYFSLFLLYLIGAVLASTTHGRPTRA